MSILVETIEEDVPTILMVAQFIGELTQEASQRTELADSPARRLVKECEALLERGEHVAVLARLLEQVPALFSKASAQDAETCLLLMANLVPRLPQQAALEAAHALCIALTADSSTATAPMRLSVLMSLFNLMPQKYGRYTVLMRILAYAPASGQADAVAAVAKRVEGWVKEWALTVEDTRALYLALASTFAGTQDHLTFLLKYLNTFETGAAVPVDAVRDQAISAAVEFLKAGDRFQCDLLDMHCVQPLLTDAKAGPVFALLKTMLEGKLGDLTALLKAKAALVKELGLAEDGLLDKMRLMSLAALGTESNSGEISYAQVKDTLQVSADEVETWIVKAIGLKLLEAKMDQLRQVVVFSRCTQRVFADAQWNDLRSKLKSWQGNLGAVTSMVAKQRIAQVAATEREAKLYAQSQSLAAQPM